MLQFIGNVKYIIICINLLLAWSKIIMSYIYWMPQTDLLDNKKNQEDRIEKAQQNEDGSHVDNIGVQKQCKVTKQPQLQQQLI